ncbi:hypothetical protein CTEN210_09070 [Chaetoceros tenuissimus]|uniref:Formiminotransferase N-terminal subdomain domain-containing protein n=1 Tax=Chaetoceros tenuissimus TaxID=426638 RepID=A0AAD3H7A6_9STRA|nr:hypothetical protein CTEN210_09070 [Chaetoceros tenuissimus]
MPSLPTLSRLTNILTSSNEVIACNIYISAGGKPFHRQPLLDILQSSQQLCRQLRSEKNDPSSQQKTVTVVHAYADIPYNRSSIHLAGHASLVHQVASHVASSAMSSIHKVNLKHKSQEDDIDSAHPLVGLVDHISCMPLVKKDENSVESNGNDFNSSCSEDEYIPNDVCGIAALAIKQTLMQKGGVMCLTYGSANHEQMPLALVRKEQTSFFKSGSCADSSKDDEGADAKSTPFGTCTVGSPPYFVENYNILLKSTVSRKLAISLAKKLRERDGGVKGVEALTLKYSGGRYEVACNLLRPDLHEGSVEAIDSKIDEWIEEQRKGNIGDDYDCFVERAYRVGTTTEQCLKAIQNKNAVTGISQAEEDVMKKFDIMLQQ